MSCFIENWRCLSKLSLLPTMMALNKCFGWGLDNYDLQLTIPNHLYPPARLFSWHHLGHYFWEGRLYLGIGIFTMRYLYRSFFTARWGNIFFYQTWYRNTEMNLSDGKILLCILNIAVKIWFLSEIISSRDIMQQSTFYVIVIWSLVK